jgi:hypothetical protein
MASACVLSWREAATSARELNQIEIWFSILARKLLWRGNFISKENLQPRIESFIASFNGTMAKPFAMDDEGETPGYLKYTQVGSNFRLGVLAPCTGPRSLSD